MISFVKLALRARFALGPLRSFAKLALRLRSCCAAVRRVLRVVLEHMPTNDALR